MTQQGCRAYLDNCIAELKGVEEHGEIRHNIDVLISKPVPVICWDAQLPRQ